MLPPTKCLRCGWTLEDPERPRHIAYFPLFGFHEICQRCSDDMKEIVVMGPPFANLYFRALRVNL
jgi:hypothetical protein